MASVAYVVSEGSFSYDDNYYSETEGSYPNKIFLDKDQAEDYAKKIGLESFKDLVLENEIFNYGYGDMDSVFDCSDEFNSFIKEKFKSSSANWWDSSRGRGRHSSSEDEEVELTEEDWEKFYSFCILGLVHISEVGFGDVFS